MSDIYGIYMRVLYTRFLKIEWIVLNVMAYLHDHTWLRSCEEFDRLSENRLISFDQQAIYN